MRDRFLDGSGPKAIAAFADGADLSRVDRYIDKIRDSLKDTSTRFVQTEGMCLLLLLAYHLFVFGGSAEITAFGIKVTDSDLVRKWFLLLPSVTFCVSTCYGYLRVYQQETIEWLHARFYPAEYKTGVYRLTFPPNYILGLDMMRREGSLVTRVIAAIPSYLFAFGAICLPPSYVWFAYRRAFSLIGPDPELIASAVLSALLFLVSFLIIVRSQKI